LTAPAEVAVNMLWCVPGGVGGSEEYLVRQVVGLADAMGQGLVERRWQITVMAARGLGAAHPELGEAARLVEAPFGSESRARRIVGEATWLRRQTGRVALVHHGGGTAPAAVARASVPYVLTVHDLQFLSYPQYFSALKRAYLSAVLPRAARGARMVAVPTEYVAASVVRAYGLSRDRIAVVPHGIDAAERTDVTPEAELRNRYSLGSGPIVVYPAVTHPHKNHDFLLRLMASAWASSGVRLVLTGGRGAAHDRVAASLGPNVLHLGRVPAADRNGLIAMAHALVFPSEYEGFGAPLIEAMTHGTPVIASNMASIPEVVGDAGLVLALHADAWAGALDEVDRRRRELIAAGHRRAAQFTARASGEALASAYEQALA
jgi:alpha-1,3-rhamnosyl/mannosyltransferase